MKFFTKLKQLSKKSNVKFSIIVASYNYEQYISETLDSLLTQSYLNYEIIVVDDGSTDNSVKIIREYVSKYSKIFLYQHEHSCNKGLAETIKLGISKSTGDYICFCESDDYWSNDHLSELKKVILSNRNVNIISNDFITFESVAPNIEKHKEYILNNIQPGRNEINVRDSYSNLIPTFSAVCVKKSVLRKCDFNVKHIGAWLDWWLWRQILVTNSLFFINKPLTFWRIHNSFNSIDKALEYQKKMDDFITDNNKIILKKIKGKVKKAFIEGESYNQILKSIEKSIYFDSDYYVRTYPDCATSKLKPIVHYFEVGWKLGYNPSEYFITDMYLNYYPDIKEKGINPLFHYFKYGKYEGRICFGKKKA